MKYAAMGIRISCAVVILVHMAGAAAQAQRSDAVITQDGNQVRGRIKNVSKNSVTITAKGKDEVIAANEVRYIALGNEPSLLRQARRLIDKEDINEASAVLGRIEPSSLEDESIRQEFAFLQAVVMGKQVASGKVTPGKAAKTTLSFLKSHKLSCHYYQAVRMLGDAALEMGNSEKAIQAYGQLANAPWIETNLNGLVLIGNALRWDGALEEAVGKYDEVLATEASSPAAERQKSLAMAGRAACLAERGKIDEQISALEKRVAETEATDSHVQACLNNALGDCYRAADNALDAELAYLHTHLLFFRDAEDHAEALYRLEKLWQNDGRGTKATEARETLQTKYGGTRWAKKP